MVGERIVLEIDGQDAYLITNDPALWLTTELLEALHRHPEDFTHMSLTVAPHQVSDGHWCVLFDSSPCFMDAVVKITNGEKTWIYQVLDYDMCADAWHARWPD